MTKKLMFGFLGLSLLSAAGVTTMANANQEARLLEINGVAGDIDIRTSPGATFNVEIIPGRRMSAELERDGATLRVKGPLANNFRSSCDNWRNSERGGARGRNEMRIDGTTYVQGDLPRIIVTGPDTMGLRIKRSLVKGSVGNVGGATINHTSCGALTMGNIARDLEANLVGSGDFKVGSIGGNVEANVAGSGDFDMGDLAGNLEVNAAGSGTTRIDGVRGRVEVNLAGSGDVNIGRVGRNVEVDIAGSGDVTLDSGQSELAASIAGSGDIRHNGTAINPSVSIVGSGDVIVARLEGQPRITRMGSGSFRTN